MQDARPHVHWFRLSMTGVEPGMCILSDISGDSDGAGMRTTLRNTDTKPMLCHLPV